MHMKGYTWIRNIYFIGTVYINYTISVYQVIISCLHHQLINQFLQWCKLSLFNQAKLLYKINEMFKRCI